MRRSLTECLCFNQDLAVGRGGQPAEDEGRAVEVPAQHHHRLRRRLEADAAVPARRRHAVRYSDDAFTEDATMQLVGLRPFLLVPGQLRH